MLSAVQSPLMKILQTQKFPDFLLLPKTDARRRWKRCDCPSSLATKVVEIFVDLANLAWKKGLEKPSSFPFPRKK